MLLEKVCFAGDSKLVMDGAAAPAQHRSLGFFVFFFLKSSNTHIHSHTDLYICVYVGVCMLC